MLEYSLCVKCMLWRYNTVKVNAVHAMKVYGGSGYIAPLIFHLNSRWYWLVNFMPQPLYSWLQIPQYLLIRGGWLGPAAHQDAWTECKSASPAVNQIMTSLTSILWPSHTNCTNTSLQFVLKTTNLILVTEMKSHSLCLCLLVNCY